MQQPSTAAAVASNTRLFSGTRWSTRENRAAPLTAASAAAVGTAADAASAAASSTSRSFNVLPVAVRKRHAAVGPDRSTAPPVENYRRLATKMLSSLSGAGALTIRQSN